LSHRVPPSDLPAEEALLGACLCNDSACDTAIDMLRPEDFYAHKHGEVFGAMLELRLTGNPVDAITVGGKLPGQSNFLTHLADSCLSATNAKHYAEIVKDLHIRRLVIKAGQEMVEAGFDKGAVEAIEASESAVYALGGVGVQDGPERLRELLLDATDRIDDTRSGKRSVGITTHLADLNDLITAITPGSFNILAARPSQGKTALACDILRHLAPELECVLFSVEMSKEEIVDRLLAAQAIVGLTRIRAGTVTDDDVRQIGDAVADMATWKLSIDDSCVTMFDVQRRVRKLSQHGPLGLVVVDYVQLLTMGRGKQESRQNEVANISRGLKLMAREFKVPVLALSQLNRPDQKYEREKGKALRPTLASLRESGALEQDADLCMFLWRPKEEEPTNIELLVAKNRSGPVGKVQLLFVPHLVHFIGRTEREE
jgi:replicative DNA helicase